MNRRIGGNNNQRVGGMNRSSSSSSSFSQQPFQNGGQCPSPWQGGGTNHSSSSSSSTNQSGILSQLTANPQLALALSSLLQPHHHHQQQQQQQQQQHQQHPPSLLSLNTSPAFSNSNNNHREYGRFPLNRGRDFRRHEPYNKAQNRGGFSDRRRRSPPRRQERRDDRKDEAKKRVEKKPEEKTATVVPKEETNNEANLSAVKEDVTDEEKKDTKRDWKEEKNNAEIKNDNSVEETETVGKKNDDDEGDGKDGKYGGIPRRYLHCFVCNKQMWDGESMGKHVRGRAHHEMLKALEESIHICVNILRENLRLQEERKTIEFNRQTRQRKFNNRREPPLSNCAMCDLKFMGKIISHRRTEGHQRLKRYLHPTCRICEKEYPSRIEWIEHCLTPEHLKRASDNTENRIGGKDGDVIVSAELEDVDMELTLEENLKMEGEDPILEMDSSLANMVDRLPAYKNERSVAVGCLKEFSGWKCDLCNRSFQNKDDADGHLKTKRHFYRFIEFIKERFDREEKKKKSNSVEESEPKHDVNNDDEEENTKEELEPNEDDEFLETAVNKIADLDEEIDQEMYDQTEKLPEEDLLPTEEVFDNLDVKIELPNVDLDIKEESCDPEEILDSVTLETNNSGIPRLARKTPLSGPKSKRGRKVQ